MVEPVVGAIKAPYTVQPEKITYINVFLEFISRYITFQLHQLFLEFNSPKLHILVCDSGNYIEVVFRNCFLRKSHSIYLKSGNAEGSRIPWVMKFHGRRGR